MFEKIVVSLQSNSISNTMATLSLSLSAKADKVTGKSEILIRFVVGSRINQRGKSNIFIEASHWNANDERIVIPKFRLMTDEQKQLVSDLKAADTQLANLTQHIMHSFQAAGSGKVGLAKDWLKSTINEFNNFPSATAEEENEAEDETETEHLPSFFEAFETYVNGKKFSENRRRHYQVLGRILKRYELYKSMPLSFDSLSADTLRDFENFLKEEHTYYEEAVKTAEKAKEKKKKVHTYLDIMEAVPLSRTPEPRGENAISDLMRRFRAFVRWANGLDKEYKLEKPFTNNNPFNAYSVPKEIYGTPLYITIEERNKLYNTKLKEPLATQRDIFVFQCCIGCRVSDLWAMTKASIIDGAVEYIPRKTKEGNPVTVRVPLNKQASEIVEKYKDYEGKGLFPFTSQQEYNRSIKEIFEAAEINRMVTVLNPTTREEEKRPISEVASSHMARRTFVGNLYKKVKDPNAIGELSGHAEGSRAFKRYRTIDEDMKKELVSLLD